MLDLKALLAKILPMFRPEYMEIQLTENKAMSFSTTWSYTKIAFNKQAVKIGSTMTMTSNGIKVSEAGYYLLYGQFGSNAPSYARIYVGTSTVVSSCINNQSGFLAYGIAPTIRKLSANDVVYMYCCKSTATNPTLASGDQTRLCVQRLPWSANI